MSFMLKLSKHRAILHFDTDTTSPSSRNLPRSKRIFVVAKYIETYCSTVTASECQLAHCVASRRSMRNLYAKQKYHKHER